MLSLSDYGIKDTSLLNKSPRQLIIVDACRTYLPRISGIPEDSKLERLDTFYTARELFDRHISASPFGKIIVHATKAGMYSYDSSEGGCFTKSLLHIAKQIKSSPTYTTASIDQVLKPVYLVLNQLDYLHYNPMQTYWQLCEEPAEYRFSSAKFYETGKDEFEILTHLMDKL